MTYAAKIFGQHSLSMIDYASIRSIHLEISSRCNAACPDCLRNYRGVDIIDTYPVCDMSLEQFKKIHPQIVADFGTGKNYIYYGESYLLT